MATRRDIAAAMLNISAADRLYHNHRLDPVDQGRAFRRLPDGTAVPLDEYDARLKAYREAERAQRADQAGADDES